MRYDRTMLFLFLLLPALLQKPTTEKAATAIIRGKVTAADTGAAVKRAQITLRPTIRPLEAVTIMADAEGVYEVKNLEAGTYQATCSKTGYVPMGYKAKRATDDPETLTLTDGQVLKDVDFQLPRGAVIAGTISRRGRRSARRSEGPGDAENVQAGACRTSCVGTTRRSGTFPDI